VKVIFFETTDTDFLFVELEKPEGTLLEVTDLSAREVEELLLKFSDIESYIVEVGRGSQFGAGGVNSKLASFTLILKEDRKKTSTDLLEDIRVKLSQVTSASVRVFQPSGGPPTGAPILVKFFGDDLDAIASAVEQTEELLKTIPGTAEVDKSTKNDALEFNMVVDRARASQVGLNPSDVAFTLRTALFGTNATTIKADGKDIDVLVKLDVNQGFTTPDTTNKQQLMQLKISNY
jgi:HAE1 family hydrophobic/amphiphilic exporter-1